MRITLENAAQNHVQLGRDGQDRAQKLGVLEECAEGRVLRRRLLPGVAATSQIDQDDTKAPYVIGSGSITGVTSRRRLETF